MNIVQKRVQSVAHPIRLPGIRRLVRHRNGRDGVTSSGCMGTERGTQRRDFGRGLANAAFAGVDDGETLLHIRGEVGLETSQIGEHLPVSQDRTAVDVLQTMKHASMPDDPFPLHLGDGVEGIELGRPDIIDRGATCVVESIGEAEVLTDEGHRITPEMTGEVVGKMRHGGG